MVYVGVVGVHFLLLGGTTSVSSAAGAWVSDRIISSWSIPDGHVLFKLLRSTRRSTLPNIIHQYITKFPAKTKPLSDYPFVSLARFVRDHCTFPALCIIRVKRWVDLTAWFTRSCTSSCVSATRLFERRCWRRPDLK
jgi:hypothetical protein